MSKHIDSDDYTYDAPHLELVRPAELDAARKRIAELERENAELRDAITAVPTSNIICLATAGVRPADSRVVRCWAEEFFAKYQQEPH